MIWLLFTLPPFLFFLPGSSQPLLHFNRLDFYVSAQLGGMTEFLELPGKFVDLWRAGFIAIELLALL